MNISLSASGQISSPTYPVYRSDIDGLRAIAVLSVVGFHAWPQFLPGGFIGVDVFFVISGFLISTIIFKASDKDIFSLKEFYLRRIRRIFPALLIVLIACYLCGWVTLLADDFKQLGLHIGAGAAFLSNFLLWHETGYFDKAAEAKPLLHLWSLGIEEQFYVFWPTLLYFAYTKKLNRLSLVILVFLVSFVLCAGRIPAGREAVFYSPISRMWELAIGSVLAHLTLHRPLALQELGRRLDKNLAAVVYSAPQPMGKTLRDMTSVLGIACIAAALTILDRTKLFPGWWALLPTVGAFLLIAAGPAALVNRTLLSNRLMQGVGLISFPLYLWHWPLLSFASRNSNWILTDRLRFGVVALSIVLAWAVWALVEQPIRRGGRLKIQAAVLAALMFVVGGVGLYTYKNGGFAFRWSALQNIAGMQVDYRALLRIGTCELEFTYQNETSFGDCTHHAQIENSGSIIDWGDSLASSLYPGLVDRYGKEFSVTQLTTGGCPALLNYMNENCMRINAYVLDRGIKERSSRVVLAGLWGHYGKIGAQLGSDWHRLGDTIKRLKAGGVTRIDLVGPFPQWNNTLADLLVQASRDDKVHHDVPTRMLIGLEPGTADLDREMREFAAAAGVNYLSAYEIMCNDEGCLTRLGDTAESLTAFDYVHLTAAGAKYMVSRFPD
jgi:peptidoglycan/LPS O-acetylase OafA/YrhL